MGAQVGGDGREEKEGQVVVAASCSCNRSRAESHRLATRSGGSQSVRGRAKDLYFISGHFHGTRALLGSGAAVRSWCSVKDH